ncbi:SusF/SusE family outer membrane protein [Segatella salivae]|uniref:SusF/SusE family outer membrane protein n=1 Tax=Segatella salivae TaxID=228604 RepID=UPI0028DC9268|nr:SusF/SusE family outer membrane protein [Segatella salivae]
MIKIKHIVAMLCVFGTTACTENNIAYDEVVNVPEGVYLSGGSSEFSLPIETGRLTAGSHANMLSIRAWLKKDGRFQISFVGTDGKPVAYGKGGDIALSCASAKAYSLVESGEGISVPAEGLYQIVVNKERKELTIIPVQFTMQGDNALTADGSNAVALSNVNYDKLTHVVTWSNVDSTQQLLPGKYVFNMNDGETIYLRDNDTMNDTLSAVFTGTAAAERTNQLNDSYQPLTNLSDVKLKFPLKGQYSVQVQYSVLTGKFTARMGGKGVEVTGLSNELYMGGTNFGAWNTNDVVKMAPVGAVGNGEFWRLCYLQAGQTIEWATAKDGSQAFSSLQTMQGVTMNGSGKATVNISGLYVVYVNLDRKLISFETPKVYASGEALADKEAALTLNGTRLSVETTETGNLNLFATSSQNARDWATMQFSIRDGKVIYPGVTAEKPALPVAKGTTVTLDIAANAADFGGTTPANLIPEGVKHLYMTGDDFGNWEWNSPEIASFENGYAGDSRWFYITYLRGGTALEFSTEKAFGNGNFAQLKTLTDYSVANNRAVVPNDGIYVVFVALDSRDIAIQPLKLSGDCGGSSVNFTTNADGRTMSATIASGGRMRIYPDIPAFKKAKKFSSWKREVYVDPVSKNFLYRKNGEGEPNKDYAWKAGTKITIDFVSKKATIEEP